MKLMKYLLVVFTLTGFIFPAVALAKPMKGTVKDIDVYGKAMTIEYSDRFKGKEENVTIFYGNKTQFKKGASPDKIKKGDTLLVDAKKDFKDRMQATLIEYVDEDSVAAKARSKFGF